MNTETFEKGKELKERIRALGVLKQVIQNPDGTIFNFDIKINILSAEKRIADRNTMGGVDINIGKYAAKEDCEYFISCIDKRIEELEQEFNNL